MENIFGDNIKFGDIYLTADGRKASFVGIKDVNIDVEEDVDKFGSHIDKLYLFIVDGYNTVDEYLSNGFWWTSLNGEDCDNIIKKYDECTVPDCIDETVNWFKNNWRKYVDIDYDMMISFRLWEQDYRVAMNGVIMSHLIANPKLQVNNDKRR